MVGGADDSGAAGAGVEFEDLERTAGRGGHGDHPGALRGQRGRPLAPRPRYVGRLAGRRVEYPQPLGALAVEHRQGPGGERGEPARAHLPARTGELLLRRTQVDRLARGRVDTVQVPPAVAVGGGDEGAVRCPLRLGDGLGGAAQDRPGCAEGAVGSDGGELELRAVPGHPGWSQAIHTACPPSGERRGEVTKSWESSESSRTAVRSSAAEPSSGTAAATRRTSLGPSPVNSSSTHHTSPRSGWICGSAQRRPSPTGESGVSGRGTAPSASGSYAYSRWSGKWEKTISDPVPGRAVPAQARPPYSMTRVRTFHGAGSGLPAVPSARRRTRARRPPSAGRGSVHHTSSPTNAGNSGRPSWEAAVRASTGDSQAP